MPQIALELAQNLGIDYHASTEELYYYMGKKDVETITEFMHTIKLIIDKKFKKVCERAILKPTIILAKNGSRQQAIFDKIYIIL